MANIAYVTFSIKSSSPKALVKALAERGHIKGNVAEVLENGEGEADFELERACTGYSLDGCITIDGEELFLSGGMKWEGWFSTVDIGILKKVCEEEDIELKEVSCYWYDETLTKMGAQAWPVPEWIMQDEDAHAYKDGFAYAYPDEDYDDSVQMPDEETLEQTFSTEEEFCENVAVKILEALKTGENPFSEDMQQYLPHCILYDYAIDAEHRAIEFTFDWDWT